MNDEERKEFEVVPGDGTEIDISPVTEHLVSMKPKSKEEDDRGTIVIPEVKPAIEYNTPEEQKVEEQNVENSDIEAQDTDSSESENKD
ncbi:MAG: hypothetical protein IKP28_02975 [Clostridia bacterium]|nr:hypothetical protein [Clostridia bacterium]